MWMCIYFMQSTHNPFISDAVVVNRVVIQNWEAFGLVIAK